jgi:type IV pilus assembly protein PilV
MKCLIKNNTGFSLIEVLISLVVMSVGLTGLLGLKVMAIKGANESHFRHEASLLTMDLADRMRANQAGVDNGSYEASKIVSFASPPTKECDQAICSADELAIFDLYQVARKMSLSMPDSFLTVNCPSNDCSTIDAVKIGDNTAGGKATIGVPAVRKMHTIKISWKVHKKKSEDMTLENIDDDKEFSIRSITLNVTP